MLWAVLGAAFGAASKDVEGAEQGITIFAVVMLVYVWSMYFHLKRQQTKRRQTKGAE